MRGMRRGRAGFTLVEIMIVVTIIGMLSAIAIPYFADARRRAQATGCCGNMWRIEESKQQWAIENFQPSTAIPTQIELEPYIKGGFTKVFCPQDPRKTAASSYEINDVQTNPKCLINAWDHQL